MVHTYIEKIWHSMLFVTDVYDYEYSVRESLQVCEMNMCGWLDLSLKLTLEDSWTRSTYFLVEKRVNYFLFFCFAGCKQGLLFDSGNAAPRVSCCFCYCFFVFFC